MIVDKVKMKTFLRLVKWGWKWVKRTMFFKQHFLLFVLYAPRCFSLCKAKKTPSSFSVSPSMHTRRLSEQRCLKAKRTPEASWGFPSWKTRKCFHVKAEFVSAGRDIQRYAAPLTEEVMSGQIPWAGIVQLMAWRTIAHKLTVSDLTEGPLVLLPFWHPFSLSPPFPRKTELSLKLDSLWDGYGSDK